jgi:hypothetical protein
MAAPPVTWTPDKIVEVVLPGQQRSISVSFNASKNLGNIALRVVPALEPYVSVSPAAIDNVFEGETVELTVTITITPNTLPKLSEGAIQVRSATKPTRTLARPLSVFLVVISELGVSPLQLTAGVPTPVFSAITFPMTPSDPRLERVNDDGTIEILGMLRDDGQNGDPVAGDGEYATSTVFNTLSSEIIRLRASATFDAPEEVDFVSPEESIVVLPALLSTEPEMFLQNVAAAFETADSVDDILPFISTQLIPTFELFLEKGVPLSELTPLFANATLLWKTHERAEFEVVIQSSAGRPMRGSIVIHKFGAEWKIVTF